MKSVDQVSRLWKLGDNLEPICDLLARGGMVAIPTESSYGLAVDPENPDAVATVAALKGRLGDKGLPVVVASVEQLPTGLVLHDGVERTLARLWPAPLTLILDSERVIAAAHTADRTLAVRVPDHPLLLELLKETGPLTATSANRAGRPPLLELRSVLEWFDESGVDGLVVDAGKLAGGPPSTLVRVTGRGFTIERLGALSEQAILSAIGRSSTGFVENSADE